MPRPDSDRKYDDASWHAGGDFPADVPYSQGGVHIAVFLAWVIRRGLYNPQLFEPADVEIVQQQSVSILGLLDRFDEKLVVEELSSEGNAFARYYYGLPRKESSPRTWMTTSRHLVPACRACTTSPPRGRTTPSWNRS